MVKRIGKRTMKQAGNRLFFISVCCIGLMGCAGVSEQEQNGMPTPTTVVEFNSPVDEKTEIKKGYRFEFKGLDIGIDMEAAQVLEELGDTKSYFEAASCAGAGMIRTYGYGSFELDTYEQDGKEYISCIYFKDDIITTMEGAYLFMTKEQLLDIYGADYVLEAGMLVYSKDKMKLKFLLEDDIVTSIQYASLVTEIKQ